MTLNRCGGCGAPLTSGTLACAYCQASLSAPSGTATTPGSGGGGLEPAVVELIRAGNKIGAIKLYQKLHGVGLVEAKKVVDAFDATSRGR